MAFTRALPPTGLDLSTEPGRIGLETFWVFDPVDERAVVEDRQAVLVESADPAVEPLERRARPQGELAPWCVVGTIAGELETIG